MVWQRRESAALARCVWEQWRTDLHIFAPTTYATVLEDRLERWPGLVDLDGLDEVPERVRLRVREAVRAVLHAYPRVARVIVTCRIRSYAGAAICLVNPAQTLAPFDENKITASCRRGIAAQADLHKRFDRDTAETRAAELAAGGPVDRSARTILPSHVVDERWRSFISAKWACRASGCASIHWRAGAHRPLAEAQRDCRVRSAGRCLK